MDSIYAFIKSARDDYYNKTVEVVPGYEFSQHQTLRTIELYHNSKFETGNKDTLKREKPFYNITKFRVNVAVRATDLDTKDVSIDAQDVGAYPQSFILTLKNRKWMREADFAQLLNLMGFTRAKFGHVVVKKVERPGELQIHVVPWRDLITDQIDITNGIKIERHFYSPADLLDMAENSGWQNVDDAIALADKLQTADVAGKSKQNRSLGANIAVWEVHGVLPDSYFDEAAKPNTYSRRMWIGMIDESDKEKVNGVTLFEGPETAQPYKDLPWEKVDGRGLGVGVIEDLFEAQVWTNYGVQQKKDMLDLAGKIIFQTTDGDLAAKNVLTDLQNGSILTTGLNTSITQVNNGAANYGAIASLMSDWDTQAENITSTYPAILGSTPPHANAAFRLQASLQNEAAAIFDYRRQEMGLFVQEMYEDWILPFLAKEIQKATEFIGDLTPDEVQIIAGLVADFDTNDQVKNAILSGKVVTQADADALKQALTQAHVKAGKKRKFKFPKGFFKGDYNVEVVTTGEQKDKQKMLTSLFQIFGMLAQNPAVLQDQTMARLFNQILEASGISQAIMPNTQKAPPSAGGPANMGMPPSSAAPAPAAPSAIPSPSLAQNATMPA